MEDLSFKEILDNQYQQWEKHQDKWMALTPENAKISLLWMIEELGEAIHIIKRKTDDAIMNDAIIREEFITEMVDVLMYYADTLLRYQITPDELAEAYFKKKAINDQREFNKERI